MKHCGQPIFFQTRNIRSLGRPDFQSLNEVDHWTQRTREANGNFLLHLCNFGGFHGRGRRTVVLDNFSDFSAQRRTGSSSFSVFFADTGRPHCQDSTRQQTLNEKCKNIETSIKKNRPPSAVGGKYPLVFFFPLKNFVVSRKTRLKMHRVARRALPA